MDTKEYSPMGTVVNNHITFLSEQLKTSWDRLERLQKLFKDNQYANSEVQEMIYSERRVWSAFKECLVNIETELKKPIPKPEL
jgi:hypothetical protein